MFSLPSESVCKFKNMSIDCNLAHYHLDNVSDLFKPNAEIAGVGVDLAFVLTSALALLTSASILVVCDYFRKASWRKLLEPAALSFSDQQLATGIALAGSMLSEDVACSTSAYHYNIVCSLVFLSIVSHLAGIIGIRGYTTKRPRWLGYLRGILISFQSFLVFKLLCGRLPSSFPTGAPDTTFHSSNNLTRLVLPVACFHSPNTTFLAEDSLLTSSEHGGQGLFLLMAVVTFYLAMMVLAECSLLSYCTGENAAGGDNKELGPSQGESPEKGSLRYILGWVRGFVLLAALVIVIYVSYKMLALKNWMDESGWLGENNEESHWTFGQILPMLILLFAVLAIVDSLPDFLETGSENSD